MTKSTGNICKIFVCCMLVMTLPACASFTQKQPQEYVSPYSYQEKNTGPEYKKQVLNLPKRVSQFFKRNWQALNKPRRVTHITEQDYTLQLGQAQAIPIHQNSAQNKSSFQNLVWTPLPSQGNVTSENAPARQDNPSVTVYPFDDILSPLPATDEGQVDFWSVMTIDSSGVQTQNFAPATSSSDTNIYVIGDQNQLSIFFKHGSDRLLASEKRQIKEFAEHIKGQQNYAIHVTGYASHIVHRDLDELGKYLVNLEMSSDRATRVWQELVKNRIPPQTVDVISKGAAHTTQNPQYDRRVDIQVFPK